MARLSGNKTKCLLDAVETPLSLIHCHTYFMFVWIAMRKLKLLLFLKYIPNGDLQSVILSQLEINTCGYSTS